MILTLYYLLIRSAVYGRTWYIIELSWQLHRASAARGRDAFEAAGVVCVTHVAGFM